MFEALQQYKSNNGDCDVPQSYPPNQKLGHWVGTQRIAKKSDKLSSDKLQKLNQLGFSWTRKPTKPTQESPQLPLFDYKLTPLQLIRLLASSSRLVKVFVIHKLTVSNNRNIQLGFRIVFPPNRLMSLLQDQITSGTSAFSVRCELPVVGATPEVLFVVG